MMKAIVFLAALFALCAASPTTLSREKRSPYNPYASTFAMAGFPFSGFPFSGFPFAGFPFGRNYAGGYAGFGYPFIDWRMPVPYFPNITPWYKGDNVCVDKKESDATDFFKDFLNDDSFKESDFEHESQTCRGSNDKYYCMGKKMTKEGMKMVMTKYECCHGFVRPADGSPGCVETNLRDLLPTLRSIGVLEMARLAEDAGLSDRLYSHNYSLFCPLDDALEAYEEELQEEDLDNDIIVNSEQQRLRRKTRLHDLITSHMVAGFLRVDDLYDGQILQTENPSGQIKINVYYTPEKVLTANCVPLVSEYVFARNGVVQVVEKVLLHPHKTVADIVAGDAQFSTLKAMLSKAGLVQTLRNPNGTYTLFAPTDSAFAAHPQLKKDKCIESVLRQHLLDHLVCSSALPSISRTTNMVGEALTLTRHHKLYVEDAQVVVRDLVAKNGVVHVIDGVLSTRRAKSLSQVLEDSGLSEFLSLLEVANLKSEFDAMENVTFFVPTDDAIRDISSRVAGSFLAHNESVRNILLYHVAEGAVELNISSQNIPSMLENTTLRVQVHSSFSQGASQALVQCAVVLSPDNKFCGGTLHVINRVLLPSPLTLAQLLEGTEGFSTLLMLMRRTGLDRGLGTSHRTLLAPTDDAFQLVGEDELFRWMEEPELAQAFILRHLLPGVVCCSQLKGYFLSGRRQIRALDGSLLRIERALDGSLLVGGARLVDCDISATNGVLHMVDAIARHDAINAPYRDNVFIRF